MNERTMRMKRRQRLGGEVRVGRVGVLGSTPDPLQLPFGVILLMVVVNDGSLLVLLDEEPVGLFESWRADAVESKPVVRFRDPLQVCVELLGDGQQDLLVVGRLDVGPEEAEDQPVSEGQLLQDVAESNPAPAVAFDVTLRRQDDPPVTKANVFIEPIGSLSSL